MHSMETIQRHPILSTGVRRLLLFLYVCFTVRRAPRAGDDSLDEP